MCPTIYNPSGVSPAVSEVHFNSLPVIVSTMNNLLNQKVWTIRSNIGSCYKGQFQNQNPNKFYCEYMVLSRWDLSDAGTINYRLYTTVTGIWAPESDGVKYTFEGFSCEDTQKVIVKKGEHKFYVHDTRTGTPINIEISGDETPVNLKY